MRLPPKYASLDPLLLAALVGTQLQTEHPGIDSTGINSQGNAAITCLIDLETSDIPLQSIEVLHQCAVLGIPDTHHPFAVPCDEVRAQMLNTPDAALLVLLLKLDLALGRVDIPPADNGVGIACVQFELVLAALQTQTETFGFHFGQSLLKVYAFSAFLDFEHFDAAIVTGEVKEFA